MDFIKIKAWIVIIKDCLSNFKIVKEKIFKIEKVLIYFNPEIEFDTTHTIAF